MTRFCLNWNFERGKRQVYYCYMLFSKSFKLSKFLEEFISLYRKRLKNPIASMQFLFTFLMNRKLLKNPIASMQFLFTFLMNQRLLTDQASQQTFDFLLMHFNQIKSTQPFQKWPWKTIYSYLTYGTSLTKHSPSRFSLAPQFSLILVWGIEIDQKAHVRKPSRVVCI